MIERLAAYASLCLLLVFPLVATVGHAQADPMVVQSGFAPALDDAGFVALPGTPTPGDLRTTATLGAFVAANEPQRAGRAGQVIRLGSRVQTDLTMQLGLGPRFALALGFPLALHQELASPSDARLLARGDVFSAPAIGDIRVQGRYRLLGTVADRTGVRADGPGLGMLAIVHLPTGNMERFAGEHTVRTELAVLADFQVLGAAIGGKAGWLHRAQPRILGGYRLADRFTYAAGLRVPMPFLPTLSAMLEVRGEADFEHADSAPLELLGGLRVRIGSWTVGLMGGGALHGALGQPAVRLGMFVRGAPPDPDGDGDGVFDDRDQCPFLPEDHDGFEDEDGCEDPDNDNDLVPDVDDLCPNEEAEIDRDDDEDGCTDP